MKNILFLTDTLGSGGAERQIVTIATLLKERGFNVGVICVTGRGFYSERLDKRKIRTFYLNSTPSSSLLGRMYNYFIRLLKIRKCVRTFKCNTLISFLGEGGLASPNIEAIISTLLYHKCNVIVGKRNNYNIRKRGFFINRLETHAQFVVANSQSGIEQYISLFPQKKEKMHVIYNIVELPPITIQYTPKQGNKLHVVIAASIREVKNTEGFIKGCALLEPHYRNRIRFDWYGAIAPVQAYYNECIALIKDNDLDNCICFHKPSDSINEIMATSDMVALFSKSEGLPNAICEAMMLGKPVIMSRCSDFGILISEGVNGYLCDWSCPNSIKEAIERAINTSTNRLLEMGKASKERALDLFSKEECIKKWTDLIVS